MLRAAGLSPRSIASDGASEHRVSMSTYASEVSVIREAVKRGLREIEKRGEKNGRKMHHSARKWERIHYTLGATAVALAAASGGTGLAVTGGRVLAAAIALGSGALAALVTFLGSEKRSQMQESRAAAWFQLRYAAQNLLDFRVHNEHWLTSGAERDLVDLRDRQARILRGEIGGEGRSVRESAGP